MWDLPGPGIEPMSPAWVGRFLTTAPPGKSQQLYVCRTLVATEWVGKSLIPISPQHKNTAIESAVTGQRRMPIGRASGLISETRQPIRSPVLNYAVPEPILPPWSPLLASEKASWGQFHNARVFGLRGQHGTPRVPRSGLTLSQEGSPVVRKRNHGWL